MFGISVHIGTLRFDEVSTFFTDLFVALIAAYSAYKISQIPGESLAKKFLVFHFITLALSTFLGGLLGHSLLHLTGIYGKFPGWLLSIVSIFALELFVLRVGGSQVKPTGYRLSYALAAALVLSCTLLTLVSRKFIWVELHTVYGLLLLTGTYGIILIRKKIFATTFKWFWGGIGATFLAGVVFTIKLSINSDYFNHLDLSHLFLGLSTVCFYKGAKSFLTETV